jgi:hypothetical protein
MRDGIIRRPELAALSVTGAGNARENGDQDGGVHAEQTCHTDVQCAPVATSRAGLGDHDRADAGQHEIRRRGGCEEHEAGAPRARASRFQMHECSDAACKEDWRASEGGDAPNKVGPSSELSGIYQRASP